MTCQDSLRAKECLSGMEVKVEGFWGFGFWRVKGPFLNSLSRVVDCRLD